MAKLLTPFEADMLVLYNELVEKQKAIAEKAEENANDTKIDIRVRNLTSPMWVMLANEYTDIINAMGGIIKKTDIVERAIQDAWNNAPKKQINVLTSEKGAAQARLRASQALKDANIYFIMDDVLLGGIVTVQESDERAAYKAIRDAQMEHDAKWKFDHTFTATYLSDTGKEYTRDFIANNADEAQIIAELKAEEEGWELQDVDYTNKGL